MLSNLSQDLLQIRSYVYAEEPNIDIHNFIGTFTRVSGCVVTLNPNLPSDMLISSPTSESLSLLCSSCNRNRARLCSTHKSELSTVISVLLNTPNRSMQKERCSLNRICALNCCLIEHNLLVSSIKTVKVTLLSC